MSDLARLVDSFLSLDRRYHRSLPQDTPAYRLEYTQAHKFLWNIAQAICALSNPEVQNALDHTRRVIVRELQHHDRWGDAVIARACKVRPIPWTDYELTPELAFDPSLLGAAVPKPLPRTLRGLLRQQRVCVSRVLEINLRDFKS